MGIPVVSRQALNRSLLARQSLLERTPVNAAGMVEQLVGMQAQEPRDPYIGLWSRVEGFDPASLEQLIEERRAVRTPALRATLHLLTAHDCLSLAPVLAPVLARNLFSGSPFGRQLAGVDIGALVAAGRALIDERPRTLAELRAPMLERWPSVDPAALTYAITHLVPVVQVPPRGLWRASGRATWTSAEHWLGRHVAHDPSPDALVLRYLAAYGPATPADVRTWSGLTGVREILERLRPQLRVVRDETGRKLLDMPDAPWPDPEAPAPPRFLGEYDNIVLAHADRRRIVSEAYRYLQSSRLLLIDGYLAGCWRLIRDRGAVSLEVHAFVPLSRADRGALEAEAERFAAYLAAGVERIEIRINLVS